MKQFYAPRFDRGFDSQPLQLGGVDYRKGLALHGRTELVYRLPERFSRFRAVAGIDDAVRPGGKVRLVVRGDDKVLLEAAICRQRRPAADRPRRDRRSAPDDPGRFRRQPERGRSPAVVQREGQQMK